MKTKLQNGEIVVSGDQWPLFVYADYHYDPEDPWNGLFVVLSLFLSVRFIFHYNTLTHLAQAYKHVFTSPSLVDKEPKATRSGNARIHGMTRVTLPSIAYIATQVRAHFSSLTCVSKYCL